MQRRWSSHAYNPHGCFQCGKSAGQIRTARSLLALVLRFRGSNHLERATSVQNWERQTPPFLCGKRKAYTFFATNTTDSQPPIGREPVGTDSVRYRRPDRPRLGRLSPVLLRNQPNRRDALSSCHNRLLVVTSSRLDCGG